MTNLFLPQRYGLMMMAWLVAAPTRLVAAPQETLLSNGQYEATELREFTFPAENARVEPLILDQEGNAVPLNGGALVRWGHLVDPGSGTRVYLTDGSLLLAGEAWGLRKGIRIQKDRVTLQREGKRILLARDTVRRIELGPTHFALPPEDALLAADRVGLEGGDQMSGHLLTMTDQEVTLVVLGEPIALSTERVHSIEFAQRAVPKTEDRCLVGLQDGSLLFVKKVEWLADTYRLRTAAGLDLEGPSNQVVFVQPLTGRVEYLSETEPLDYRHTPYFALTWPCGFDTLPRGEPLRLAAQRYAKGVSMHSASRLVYGLDGGERRFQAELSLADPTDALAPSIGSIQARVLLIREGKLEPAYRSKTLRYGDPPERIDLDTTGAEGLVLLVDYADQADTGDDALWLDARLVAPLGG